MEMERTAITSRLSTRRGGGSSSATNHGGSRNLFFYVLSGSGAGDSLVESIMKMKLYWIVGKISSILL